MRAGIHHESLCFWGQDFRQEQEIGVIVEAFCLGTTRYMHLQMIKLQFSTLTFQWEWLVLWTLSFAPSHINDTKPYQMREASKIHRNTSSINIRLWSFPFTIAIDLNVLYYICTCVSGWTTMVKTTNAAVHLRFNKHFWNCVNKFIPLNNYKDQLGSVLFWEWPFSGLVWFALDEAVLCR